MVTGPSGAGKSTLTRLLLRFYDPTARRLAIDGVDLTDLPLRTVRDTIALVQQEVAVFHSTAERDQPRSGSERSSVEPPRRWSSRTISSFSPVLHSGLGA
ncbi:ATP-binding cassette domain-containing protein [Saccharopolyspora spinosa]|uniref:ATP-binding cassette domain-containing protein n=1 Tax=Saccharopolyspora spinosa TaxID=60894 RepID=UPI000A2F05DC|nr:ATP-binding cassette domain-containing protein [Saccharopolyspora spinosa]